MLTKHRVLAVTKCDLLDDELCAMLHDEIRAALRELGEEELPIVFISAVTGKGLDQLKDVLWQELNSESNKIEGIISREALVHRDKDMSAFLAEQEAEGEDGDLYEDDDLSDDAPDWEDTSPTPGTSGEPGTPGKSGKSGNPGEVPELSADEFEYFDIDETT